MNAQELKTNVWKKIQGKAPSYRYDEVLDTFLIFFSEEETERLITHFVDENVAFLFRHSDNEIVGMRIEYFKEEFLRKAVENNGWKLSETGEKINGLIEVRFNALEVHKIVTRPLAPTVGQYTIPALKQKIRLEPVYG